MEWIFIIMECSIAWFETTYPAVHLGIQPGAG